MQVRKELGNMDDNAPQRTVAASGYWARRMPRTAAKGAIFIEETTEKAGKNPRIEDKAIINACAVVVKKSPQKRKVTWKPISLADQVKIEASECRRERRQRQQLEVMKIIGAPRTKAIRELVLVVSYVSGEKVKDIVGPSRKRQVVTARAVVCIMARLMGHSLTKIGHVIDRDHSSVLNLTQNASLRPDVNNLAKKVAKLLVPEGSE